MPSTQVHDWTYIIDRIVKIVDGDTYYFIVDLGFGTYQYIETRLIGVDTHETYGVPKDSEEYQKGIIEKQFVEDWFESKDKIVIRSVGRKKGKYGRWLVEVYGDGENLGPRLLEEFENIEA